MLRCAHGDFFFTQVYIQVQTAFITKQPFTSCLASVCTILSSVLVINVVNVPLYLLIGLARQHLQYVPHLSFSLVNFVFVEVSLSLSLYIII